MANSGLEMASSGRGARHLPPVKTAADIAGAVGELARAMAAGAAE